MPKCPFCGVHKDTGSGLQEHLSEKHPDDAPDIGGPRKTQTKRIQKTRKKPLVIDGDSVATVEGDPQILLLKKARMALVKLGFSPTIFVSSKIGKKIDDQVEYNRLCNLNWIIETEDLLESMAELASKKHCSILSNSSFNKTNVDTQNWSLKTSQIKFSYNDGTFVVA
ncbi:MAG: NYN domain-containing protein [Candidatus Kariarchaeaceae archaeon]|jgi:hypothetical protein